VVIRPVYFYYTDHQESFRAVTRLIPQAEHVDTSPSSYAYWDELERRWDGSADLLVMEQHIIVHGQVLPQLEACPGDWCVFPFGGQRHGLGCTRFSAALQQAVPASEIRRRARRKCPHCGSLHFAFVDGPILDALRAAGYGEPCIHQPPVDHLPE
jgi:hypothetical protein